MEKTFVYDHNGIKYTLLHPPRKGGEGEVFRLSENPALCAKIYYRNVITEEIQDKITSMIDNPPTGDLTENKKKARSASIAWPVSRLYRLPGRKDFCGFLMPVIDTELFREAHMYYDPEDRKKYLSGSFTWKYLLTATYNIAYTVSAIHKSGHCIGDMSGSNILVARTAAISIIDCDSFQIENKKTGQKFFTKVATGDYLAPELMGINFRTENIDRYYSDLFSLSILIFKFLMNGVHPFQARGKGVEDHPTTEHKIKNGIFPYQRNIKQIYPPLYAPPYAILSPGIRALFERCFIKGINKPYMRPDADEWIKVLQDELSGLKQCDSNPNHWHSGYLDICPWCSILKIKKKEYFPYNGPKIVKVRKKAETAEKPSAVLVSKKVTVKEVNKDPENKSPVPGTKSSSGIPAAKMPYAPCPLPEKITDKKEEEKDRHKTDNSENRPPGFSGKITATAVGNINQAAHCGNRNNVNNQPANSVYKLQNSAKSGQSNNQADNTYKRRIKENNSPKAGTKNYTDTAGTEHNSPPENNTSKSEIKQKDTPEADKNTDQGKNRTENLKHTVVKQKVSGTDDKNILQNKGTEVVKEEKKPEIIKEKPKKIILMPEIRPDKINISFDPDSDNKAEIEIINKNQDKIEITAKPLHKWILLPENVISAGDKKTFEITVDNSHFEGILPGVKYKSWIEFKTPAGNKNTEVNVSLQKDPVLTVIPKKRILFRGIEEKDAEAADDSINGSKIPGGKNNIRIIEIINSGERTLKGKISSDKKWITAKPDSFFTKTKQKISIVIIPEQMEERAIQTGKIAVKSNGGEWEIQVIASIK